jgi:hypothetical protein
MKANKLDHINWKKVKGSNQKEIVEALLTLREVKLRKPYLNNDNVTAQSHLDTSHHYNKLPSRCIPKLSEKNKIPATNYDNKPKDVLSNNIRKPVFILTPNSQLPMGRPLPPPPQFPQNLSNPLLIT